MIGVVIVAHGPLAQGLVAAAEFIVGQRLEQVKALEVVPGQTPEQLQQALSRALEEADQGQGVLVMVDMFGGSPSDMAISFLQAGRVEILTGVNLPMLLEVVLRRPQAANVTFLAAEAERKAAASIALASKMLNV